MILYTIDNKDNVLVFVYIFFVSSLTLLSLARVPLCHLKEGDAMVIDTFTKRNDKNPFFNLTLPDYSTAAFADLDNDGDDMQVLIEWYNNCYSV